MNEYNKKFISQNKLKIFDINAYSLRERSFFKNIFEYRDKILKNQKKRIKKLRNFTCNLCGKKKGTVFLSWKKNYKLLECNNCGSISPNI